MERPPTALEDLTKRMEDIVHKIADAQGHAAAAEKKIRDADDGIDKLKSDRIAADGEKHAAEAERDRQQDRLIALMHDSLRDFRSPPPPPRPVEDWRARRWFPEQSRRRRHSQSRAQSSTSSEAS